ncbi:dicarboxylate/amino acid:cation symporter [Flavobacterium sp. MK4S-17]|uniref:dicarboxylate/amino acid:cation symporter n=1 Tax=Flavobacterium sp. MK4S-17 TaxID=2543737 RepID=UPI001357EFB5|nr:cation:dicarboxylase symporter family transporter [Flavobacterium sp. MK4S-17]
MFKSRFINLFTLAVITLTAIIYSVHYIFENIPEGVLTFFRWASVAGLILYGFKKRSLTTWILVCLVIGACVGYEWPDVAVNLRILSKIFLKLIKTIVGPLIFGTLVYGIAGHSDIKQVGRMGWKSLLYFEVVTTIALFIGVAAINLFPVGKGIEAPAAMHEEVTAAKAQTWQDIILHIFPENIARSMAEGEVLQIVVFSVLFGLGLIMVPERKRKPMVDFTQSLSEVMFKFTNIVMYFAPIGVGAAMAYTVGHMGLSILGNLFGLLFLLYGALAAFVLFVLLPIALIARIPLKPFLRAIKQPVSIAFATTSSEAALPRAMEAMESIGVPRKVVSFVMPMGYSFNLDGTTLYLSLASIFVAQAAGIDLSLGEQLIMVFTLMVTSKGVAGIPRASLVILMGTAASFNLPVWPIMAILGIDELMDMARTSINVVGNCLASAFVARWEGEFDADKEGADEVFEAEPQE